MASGCKINVLKAIHDQHPEYRERQRFSEIIYIFRHRLFARKNDKGQEAREYGTDRAKCYCNYLLCEAKRAHS